MYHSVCNAVREECKKLPGLNSGWFAATKKFIELLNKGKVTMRNRGKTKRRYRWAALGGTQGSSEAAAVCDSTA